MLYFPLEVFTKVYMLIVTLGIVRRRDCRVLVCLVKLYSVKKGIEPASRSLNPPTYSVPHVLYNHLCSLRGGVCINAFAQGGY